MAKCGYCGSTIVMGGVRTGDQRFCNNRCHTNAYNLCAPHSKEPAEPPAADAELDWTLGRNKCRRAQFEP